MSINVPTHFSQQYATNIQLLLQQRGHKLRGLVSTGSHVGKAAQVVQQFGAIEMQPVIGRFQPMGRVDAPADARWVHPTDWDLPQLIDAFDLLRLVTDPTSMYVQNSVFAAGRKMDDLLIDAAFGTAKTGETGATSTTFPAAQQIAVDFGAAGAVGMTVAKLKEARRLLKAAEVDLDTEELTVILTAQQESDLLSEAEVTSRDFTDRPVLTDGKLTRFLGFNFRHSERLDTNGSGYRRCPAFAKSGLYLGIWGDLTTNISRRNDLQSEPWQIYAKMTMGATRLEEKKVVEIICSEA